jgi:hypothetical protein
VGFREFKAQCVFQHWEEEFRVELEEEQHIIAALITKVGFRAQQICNTRESKAQSVL